MRAFIAIDLPPELKDKIVKLISELQAADFGDASWVSKQQLHLTLKFLGEIGEQQITKVKSVLKDISRHQKSFDLQLKGIGHFNQKVLWIGGTSKDCIDLANKIDNDLSALGFQGEERDFTIHLTLARIQYIKNKAKFNRMLEVCKNDDFGKFKVDKIKLMESVLSAGRSIYKTIAEFSLG
jgi:2'-5' RNA ligase